jgi:hypothetical protein
MYHNVAVRRWQRSNVPQRQSAIYRSGHNDFRTSEQVLINSAVFEATIGEETVLLNEDTGQLVLLDTVAAVFWQGLNSGLSAREIAVIVANQCGADETTIQSDFTELLELWVSQGLLQSGKRCEYHPNRGHAEKAQDTPAANSNNHRTPTSSIEQLVHLGTFGVGDVEFDLFSSAPEVKQAADQVFDHLRTDSSNGRHFVLTVEREQDEWIMFCNGKYEVHCHD